MQICADSRITTDGFAWLWFNAATMKEQPYLFILLLRELLLLGDLDLGFLRLLGLLHLLLHLQLLGEAGDQLGLEPLGAQGATVQLLTEVVHLRGGRREVRGGDSPDSERHRDTFEN